MTQPALLALEDGTVFKGVSIGAPGLSVGEVVFNTAMTGYQEVLTDPSYARQLVTLTYPHIGNTGMTAADDEAAKVWASGLIVRDVPRRPSNWRSEQSLAEWMRERGIVGISDLDTRALTRRLREGGAQNGAVMAGDGLDADAAIEAARKFPGLTGMDLAREVTTQETYAQVDRVLRPGGSAMLNLIDHGEREFLAAEVVTMQAVFAEVAVYHEADDTDGGNFVLLASQEPLDDATIDAGLAEQDSPMQRMSEAEVAELTRSAQVLTDDHAPVDQLLSQT